VRLVIAAAGRLKERELRALCDDYLGRIRRYVRCDEIEAKAAAELEGALPDGALRVALEVTGDAVTSTELSRRLERWGSTGKGIVAFVIGDADGIPPELSRKAHARLSLSPLTLPHRLARLILLEQLYRALTIQRGEPYARE